MHTLVIIAALLAVAVALPISPAARHQAKKHADNSDPEFGVRGLFKAPEDVLATRHIKRTIMGVIGSSGYSNPSSSSESFGSKGWSTGGRDDDWRDAERRRRKRKRCRGKNKEKPRCRGRGRWGSASAESNLNIPVSWDDAEMHFMSWEDPEVAHGHKGKREEASRDVAHSTSLLHSRVIRSLIPGLSYPKPPTQSSSSSFGSKGWSSSSSSSSWRDEEDEWRAWRRRERRRRRRKCRGKKGQKKAACKRRWRNRGRGRKGPADGKAQHKLHPWETFESPTASKVTTTGNSKVSHKSLNGLHIARRVRRDTRKFSERSPTGRVERSIIPGVFPNTNHVPDPVQSYGSSGWSSWSRDGYKRHRSRGRGRGRGRQRRKCRARCRNRRRYRKCMTKHPRKLCKKYLPPKRKLTAAQKRLRRPKTDINHDIPSQNGSHHGNDTDPSHRQTISTYNNSSHNISDRYRRDHSKRDHYRGADDKDDQYKGDNDGRDHTSGRNSHDERQFKGRDGVQHDIDGTKHIKLRDHEQREHD